MAKSKYPSCDIYLISFSVFLTQSFVCPVPFSSLKSVRTELLQQLQSLQGAPSVQMQEVPPPFERVEPEDDEKSGTSSKKRKTHGSELYDKVD
jgi:hypothetical protein